MKIKKKLSILFLTTSFPSNLDDPSGFFVYQLALALHDQGADLSVVTPQKNRDICVNSYPFSVQYFRYAPRKFQVLAQLPGGIPVALKRSRALYCLVPFFLGSFLFNILKQARKSDVIVANWAFCGLLAGFLKRFHKHPVITVLRGSDVIFENHNVMPKLLKKSILISDSIVCVGSDHTEIFNKISNLNKVVSTIPNGIHQSFYQVPPVKPTLPLKLTFVGSLIRRKRVDTLFHALAQLKDLSIQLQIVGEGPLENELKYLAVELGIEKKVDFLGKISPGASVSHIMSDTHILILPSEHEGRPNVAVEAMASGRPIVGTNICGIKELVAKSNSGKLFAVGDSTALAESIHEYYQNVDGLVESGRCARNWIEEQGLTWENTSKQYLTLCQTVLSEKDKQK